LLDYRINLIKENMFFTLELFQETSYENKIQVQNLKACISHVTPTYDPKMALTFQKESIFNH
jgi:hypothetical protein